MIVAGFILRHALHCHTVRQQVLASVALAVAPSSSSPSSLLQSDTGKLSAGQTVLQDKQALLSKISGCVNRWLNLKTRHRYCSFEWLWCFSACWCLVTYVICRDLFVCLGRGKHIVAVIWHLIYVGGLILNLFACQMEYGASRIRKGPGRNRMIVLKTICTFCFVTLADQRLGKLFTCHLHLLVLQCSERSFPFQTWLASDTSGKLAALIWKQWIPVSSFGFSLR